jgi:hypothetical protein
MKEDPIIMIPSLEEISLAPANLADATDMPIRDEETRILRDEQGLPICEG